MKTLKKRYLITLSLIVMSTAVFAVQKLQLPMEYRVQVLKDCDVVAESIMTPVQRSIYIELQQQEKEMSNLEVPLQSVESKIESYTQKIEEMTKSTLIESVKSVYLDENVMAQQQDVLQELESFMSEHQHMFTKIEEQGERISQQAERFEQSIQSILAGVDYDHVRILSPQSTAKPLSCDHYQQYVAL